MRWLSLCLIFVAVHAFGTEALSESGIKVRTAPRPESAHVIASDVRLSPSEPSRVVPRTLPESKKEYRMRILMGETIIPDLGMKLREYLVTAEGRVLIDKLEDAVRRGDVVAQDDIASQLGSKLSEWLELPMLEGVRAFRDSSEFDTHIYYPQYEVRQLLYDLLNDYFCRIEFRKYLCKWSSGRGLMKGLYFRFVGKMLNSYSPKVRNELEASMEKQFASMGIQGKYTFHPMSSEEHKARGLSRDGIRVAIDEKVGEGYSRITKFDWKPTPTEIVFRDRLVKELISFAGHEYVSPRPAHDPLKAEDAIPVLRKVIRGN